MVWTLYAPAQAVLYRMSFQGMVVWIVARLPRDFIYGVSNFFCGILIMPIVSLLRFAERHVEIRRIGGDFIPRFLSLFPHGFNTPMLASGRFIIQII